MSSGSRPTSDTDSATVADGYRHRHEWLRYQEFFPGGLRITPHNAPSETFWPWRGLSVHLDTVRSTRASAKLVMLHGLGTYGRMLAPYARLPALEGLEIIAPDLPGHGLSPTPLRLNHETWVRCVIDLIDAEHAADARPVLLFGMGLGGWLALQVACRRPDKVNGVMVTGLADPRRGDTRASLAGHPAYSRLSGPFTWLPTPGFVRAPLPWLVNIAAVSNDQRMAACACGDELAGGAWIPMELLRTYLCSAPARRPDRINGPPLLLAQPTDDRWLPPALAREFFGRLAAPKRHVALEGAGHLPVEEAGLAMLDRAIRDFVDEFLSIERV